MTYSIPDEFRQTVKELIVGAIVACDEGRDAPDDAAERVVDAIIAKVHAIDGRAAWRKELAKRDAKAPLWREGKHAGN